MVRIHRYLTTCAARARYLAAWTFSLLFPAFCCLLLPFWGPQTIWRRLASVWAKATLGILGIRVHLIGALPQRPAIYVANHQSLLDVIAMPALLPAKTRFVARQNLKYVPFWGWIFIWGGAVAIRRRAPGSGDVARLKQGLRKLPAGWSLMVFPEGTRGRAHRPRPFRKGAAICAAERALPLLPLGVCDLSKVAPAGRSLLTAGDVFVAVGKPIWVTDPSDAGLATATAEAHRAVIDCIGRANRLLAQHCAEKTAPVLSSHARRASEVR